MDFALAPEPFFFNAENLRLPIYPVQYLSLF